MQFFWNWMNRTSLGGHHTCPVCGPCEVTPSENADGGSLAPAEAPAGQQGDHGTDMQASVASASDVKTTIASVKTDPHARYAQFIEMGEPVFFPTAGTYTISASSNGTDWECVTCSDPDCGCKDTASRSTSLVSERESIQNSICDLEDEIEELRKMLDAVTVKPDVSAMFECMADDSDYSIIGDPIEYSRTDDELIGLAKVIFDGSPYVVICRATEGVEEWVDTHFVYIHLADDFSFTLANTIYASRREIRA